MKRKKAKIIYIVLVVCVVYFRYNFLSVEAGPAHYYFNNAVSTSPLDLGNYWTDPDQTVPAVAIPDNTVVAVDIVTGATYDGNAIFSIDAVNFGTVTGDATFYNDSFNFGFINGTATFNDDSYNDWILVTPGDIIFNDNSSNEDGAFSDTIIFNDNSQNNGNIEGNVIFNNSSFNNYTVIGSAIFNDNSTNQYSVTSLTPVIFNDSSIHDHGVIVHDAIFNDSSIDQGDINGNAVFVNDNSETIFCHIDGTFTREYTVNTTTSRNLTQCGPMTVVANGAIVDVTSAHYDGTTIFVTRNGGSFIPSFLNPSTPHTSGGGGIIYKNPIQGSFLITLNGGETETSQRLVRVTVSAGSNASRMALSNSTDFSGSNLQPFNSLAEWDICGSAVHCSEGSHTVYARFYTSDGQSSPTVSATIIYKETKKDSPPLVVSPVASPLIHKNVSEGFFKRNLRFTNIGSDVKQLQQFLNTHNFKLRLRWAGSPGKETFYFGPYTRQALRKYQKAHSLSVTGILDTNTRAYINQVIRAIAQ